MAFQASCWLSVCVWVCMGVRGEYFQQLRSSFKKRIAKERSTSFTIFLPPTLSYCLTLCLSGITLINLLIGSCNAPLSQLSRPSDPQSLSLVLPHSYRFLLRSRSLIAYHSPTGNKMDREDLYLKTRKSYIHLSVKKIKYQISF